MLVILQRFNSCQTITIQVCIELLAIVSASTCDSSTAIILHTLIKLKNVCIITYIHKSSLVREFHIKKG